LAIGAGVTVLVVGVEVVDGAAERVGADAQAFGREFAVAVGAVGL